MDPPPICERIEPLHEKIERLTRDASEHSSPKQTFVLEIWPKVEHDYHGMLKVLRDYCNAQVKNSATIEGRVKTIDSIEKSIDRRQRYREEYGEKPYQSVAEILRDVHDIVGVRIVVDFTTSLKSVNQLIGNMFQQEKEPNVFGPDRRVEYMWKPWFGAYQSWNHHVSIKPEAVEMLQSYRKVIFEVQVTCLSESLYNRLAHPLLYKGSRNLSRKDEMVIDMTHGLSLCYSICLLYFEDSFGDSELLDAMRRAAASPNTKDDDGSLSQLAKLVSDKPAGGPNLDFAPRMPSFKLEEDTSSTEKINVRELLSLLKSPSKGREDSQLIESIKEMIEDIVNLENKIPQVLEARPDSESVRSKPQCCQGTRVKILDEIESWVNSPEAETILWLYGPAGIGKSTIARTLALRCNKKNTLAAGYFFGGTSGDSNSTSLLFPTISKQLVTQIPGFRELLRDSLASDPRMEDFRGTFPSLALKDQFEIIIQTPLTRLNENTAKRRVIIIDGLDECQDAEKFNLVIKNLSSLCKIKNSQVCVLLTSRYVHPIEFAFRQLGMDEYREMRLHELFKRETKDDIRRLLEIEFERIREKKEIEGEWPNPKDVDLVVYHATTPEPLFIYAAMLILYIDNPKGTREPVSRLNKWITQCSKNKSQLSQVYEPILSDALGDQSEGDEDSDDEDDKHTLLKVLGAIVCVKRPLSVKTLASLLNLQKTNVKHWLGLLHPVLRIPEDSRKPITIFHKSFSDFLLGEKLIQNSFDIHEELAMECLDRIAGFSKPWREIRELNDPAIDIDRAGDLVKSRCIPSEISYACKYWVHHWRESQNLEGRVEDRVKHVLENHLLLWIEVLAFLDSLCAGKIAIRDVRQILSGRLSQSQLSRSLLGLVEDIQKFLFEHRFMISFFPLQLRGLGLIFSPQECRLKQTLPSQLPPFVQNISGDTSEWFPRLLQIIDLPQYKKAYQNLSRRLCFSPDGQTMVVAHPGYLTLLDVRTGISRGAVPTDQALPEDQIIAMVFAEDGKRVKSISWTGKLQTWEMNAKVRCSTRCILQESRGFECAAISQRQSLVAASMRTGSKEDDLELNLWDFETGKLRGRLKNHAGTRDRILNMSLSPDDKTLAVQVARDELGDRVDLWNIPSQTRATSHNCLGHTSGFDYSPDGTRVAAVSSEIIRLLDVTTGSIDSASIDLLFRQPFARFLPDGKRLAIYDHCAVSIWDIPSPKKPALATGDVANDPSAEVIAHPSLIQTMALSPDQRTLATSSRNHVLLLWDLQSNSVRCDGSTEANLAQAMAFSPDGTTLAVIANPQVQFWKVDIEAQLCCFDWDQPLPPDLDDIRDCSFSTYSSNGFLKLGLTSEAGRKCWLNLGTRLYQESNWLRVVPISVSGDWVLYTSHLAPTQSFPFLRIPKKYESAVFAWSDNRLVVGHLDGQFATVNFNLPQLDVAWKVWVQEKTS